MSVFRTAFRGCKLVPDTSYHGPCKVWVRYWCFSRKLKQKYYFPLHTSRFYLMSWINMEAYTHHDKKHSDEGQYLFISLHIVILMLARFHFDVYTKSRAIWEVILSTYVLFVNMGGSKWSLKFINIILQPTLETWYSYTRSLLLPGLQDYNYVDYLLSRFDLLCVHTTSKQYYLGSNWCGWSSIAGNPPFVSLNALFWKEWLSILILYFILW